MLQIASGSTLDARKGPINEVVVFLFFAYVRGNQGISSVVNQDEMSQIEPGSALDLRWAQLMRPRSFFFFALWVGRGGRAPCLWSLYCCGLNGLGRQTGSMHLE
jgi:hypothetical protein